MSIAHTSKPAVVEPARLLRSASQRVALIICLLAIVLFFVTAGEDWLTIVNYTLIAAIATIALNVLSGYTGQVSLGIAFFMAIGAYTAAWLGGTPPTSPSEPTGLGLSFLIWLPASGIVTALVGALIGPTALRLKGFYLGIVSLALVFIGHYLFLNAAWLTGGPQGRTFPTPAFGSFSFDNQNDLFGIALTSGQQFFLLLLLILVVCALFVGNVMRSRAGRAFQAVRDNEVGASIMGINLFEAKMGAFIFSSFLAGVAGALLASYTRYIVPNYWDLTLSIQFVAAIIVGGIASVRGSILGAAFVFALPRVIDQFSLLPVGTGSGGISSGDLNALIYGFLIIVFLLFEPGGVIGLVRRSQGLVQRFKNGGEEGGEPAEMTDLPAPRSEMQPDSESQALVPGEGA
ncbi:MAG: branched-chain amino acid ABC transporter permease [Ktedonobacteraceae bacterium]|nr:branched-chain amino acid ABC transporter permease [Chloroflexota bacterium]